MPERIRFEMELADLGLSEVGKGKAVPKIKNVILVAGFDHEFSGAEFSRMCETRRKILIKRHPKLNLKFTIFDVEKGTVKLKETDAKGKLKETLVKSFDPVSSSNYDMTTPKKEKVFVSGANVMSILDIYSHIQQLGKTEPGSLIEFSIFSHGWIGGPILVNSKVGANDKDARASHFNNATRVSELKAAFDKEGIAWVWGCNFAKAFLIVFAEMRRNSKYKSKGLKDSVVLNLDFSEEKKPNAVQQELEHRIYTGVWEILGGAGNAPINTKKPGNLILFSKSMKFEDLRNVFVSGLEDTFSQKMAVPLGITVHGALPGTYSDYEKSGDKLMLVSRKSPPYDDDFSSIINFYKTYLMIQMAPENRGYAKYPF
jgi:hypothetical protein